MRHCGAAGGGVATVSGVEYRSVKLESRLKPVADGFVPAWVKPTPLKPDDG